MSAILPIDIDALLRHRTVESERVESKASWDADTTGRQVIRTICAFANDYHNLNGGYVVIGVEEREGRSVLPPQGLTAEDVEAAQRWIRGQCNRLYPPYPPVLSPECVQDKLVLVIWAPASEMRPHRAPGRDGSNRYWIRLGAETIDAEQRGDLIRSLMEQTAKVPWDDRRAAPKSRSSISPRIEPGMCKKSDHSADRWQISLRLALLISKTYPPTICKNNGIDTASGVG